MSENDDFLMEDWTDEYVYERLELPRVWTVLGDEFEIQELKTYRIDEVINIIQKHYFVDEPLMVNSKIIEDNESVKQYLYLVRHWMMDTLSTVAVEKNSGKIVGFIICRFNESSLRDPEFSRECLYEGEKWNEIQKFKHHLTKKSNAFEHFNVDKILEVYSWFVLPQYRGKGIGSGLLGNVALRQLPEYAWYDTNVIAGLFTGTVSQRVAESLGMRTLYDFAYAGWTVKVERTGDREPFFEETTSRRERSARVMAMRMTVGARAPE